QETGERGKKIELRQNFRSRASVLESINEVFFQIMTKNLGNIQYTQNTALHPGAVFQDTDKKAGTPTELLMVDTGTKVMGPADEELEEYTSREIEARLIARRIRQMTDPEEGLWVWDKEKESYRVARYSDIVILLRSLTGWTDSFLNVLTQEGIPAFAETGTGYFNTIEVETILAMLAVIDNPMQDIPLAAVLKSPITGMSEEELAFMAAAAKRCPVKGQDRGIYGALKLVLSGPEEAPLTRTESWETAAARAGVPEALRESILRKIKRFSAMLKELRREAAYVPIHELIHRMYLKTGYYAYVSAMPAGEARKANLDMLIEKAWAYEKTSYKGLFHFIRYIEKLKKYDTDFGEATGSGKAQDMVRVMSIHKSKGLEFPVVFLAGLGKLFNKQDVRGKLLIDSDLGIAADYLDVETRVKTPTLKKNVLKRKMDGDNLGEELRVLYVAMTRAKEKLIMTCTDRYLEKKMEKWRQKTWDSRQIPYTILLTAGSYLDWMLMAVPEESPLFHVEKMSVEELVGEAVEQKLQKTISEEELKTADLSKTFHEEAGKRLAQRLSYEYPYRADIDLHTKMSVSQLKKQGQDIDDKNSLFQPAIPDFLKETGEEGERRRPGGAVRGSAYHRVLELLDLGAMKEEKDVDRWLLEAVKEGSIPEEARKLVSPKKLWRFLKTSLGRQMARAQKENRLHREQQFVMGIPAADMGMGDSKELVLIQGIIDAWIDDDDGILLIDYKTDHIPEGQEEILIKRYKAQLDYYGRALEQIRKKPVKKRVIYSLTLEKSVEVCL
ncbi:MAG: helicase, partial [Hungatella sp.]|nr:helicase [Hungatella sp.]